MTGLWIAGLVGWLIFVIACFLVEPVRRFLVKHRWAVDHDKLRTE